MKELKLYGQIGEEVKAKEVCAFLDSLQDDEPALLALHTAGGSVLEGNAIANAIAKRNITIRIDGLAASMGAILLPYAKRVLMADNAFIMVHQPRVTAGGTKRELRTIAKVLESMTDDFVVKLCSRTNQSQETVRGWLEGDSWFSASEALQAGLIDEIIPAVASTATATASLAGDINSVLALFDHCLACDNTTDNAPTIEDKNLETINQQDTMKKDLIEALGLPLSLEQDDHTIVEAVAQKIEALEKQNEELVAQLHQMKEKEVAQIVDSAIVEGKLREDGRPVFVEIGLKAGVEKLQKMIDAMNSANPVQSLQQMIAEREHRTAPSWDTLDRQGKLPALKATDYTEFCRLFKEKFGRDYTGSN